MKIKLLSLMLLSLVFESNAQVIFRQDFSTLNNGKLDAQNGWTNNSSAGGTGGAISGAELVTVSIDPSMYTYPGYGNASKYITMKHDVDQDGPGHLLATPITSGTYYFSFLGNFSAYPTGANFYDVLRMLNGGAFTTSARIWVQPGSTAAGFKVGIKIGDSVNPAGVTASDYAFNQTHLFVVKYVINPQTSSDDTMTLYIDPVYASGEPAIPTLTAPSGTFENSNNIDRVAFPYNTPKAGKATGKIAMLSIARTWNELNFPETLAAKDLNINQNFTLQYEKGKVSIQQLGFNNSDFKIFSIEGKLVFQSKLNTQKNQQLLVGQLEKGVYFFNMQNGKKSINKKFIVNN